MKKILVLTPLALLLLACSLFGSTAEPEQSDQPAADTAITDPSRQIEVNAGESFTIVIDSNPTTGYHWEIVGELNGVEFVSRDYKADQPVLTGSGGVDVWSFKAVSAGETQITLGSYPPGVDGEPEQSVKFSIEVK